jgi:hypothetical protein
MLDLFGGCEILVWPCAAGWSKHSGLHALEALDRGLGFGHALIELIETTTGDEQSEAVIWLVRNSLRIPIRVADADAG